MLTEGVGAPMFALAVGLAVVAALVIALGAELQEHAAVRAGPRRRGPLGFFLTLLHDPRWVAGALSAAAGVGLHATALTMGSVAAIQPVGTVGLLFAVGIKAVIDRTPVERTAIAGCAAVVCGLAILLTLLPHAAGTTTVRPAGAWLAGGCALTVTGAALLLPRGRLPAPLRAGAVALGAGMCFGVGAALVGVVGRRMERDVTAVVSWPSVLVVVLLVCGGAAQQLAYRMARFAVVYAVLLTADPITAGFTGALLLGEPMPTSAGKVAGLAAAAFVTVAGIVVLSQARAANRTPLEEVRRACPDRD